MRKTVAIRESQGGEVWFPEGINTQLFLRHLSKALLRLCNCLYTHTHTLGLSMYPASPLPSGTGVPI